MHTPYHALHRSWLAALAVVALLAVAAEPAEAQRGRGHHASGAHFSGAFGHGGHFGFFGGRFGGHFGFGDFGVGHFGVGRQGGVDRHGFGRHFGITGRHGFSRFGRGPFVYGPYVVADADAYRGRSSAGFVQVAPPGPYIEVGGYRVRNLSWEAAMAEAVARAETFGAEAESDAAVYDLRPEPARAKLAIEPGDASVYLDGEFVALASELPETLLIEPGNHLLEVVRPGFASRQVELELEPGEEIELDAGLEPGE